MPSKLTYQQLFELVAEAIRDWWETQDWDKVFNEIHSQIVQELSYANGT